MFLRAAVKIWEQDDMTRLNLESFSASMKRLFARLDWQGILAVLSAFLVTRLMVVVVVYFSMAQIPVSSGEYLWRYNPRNLIADGLIRWDSGFYISIADHGYAEEFPGGTPWDSHFSLPIPNHGYNDLLAAFFPLYPLLIRLTAALTGNLVTAGLWVSNLSFLMALFYLYALTKQEFDGAAAGRMVFYLAAAPAAFFFSAVYAESTLLLFVAAGFYYARNGKWLLAGLVGALASATRLPGMLIALYILLEAFWQQGFRFLPRPFSWKTFVEMLKADLRAVPRAWKGLLASLLATSGLLAHMAYLYATKGDALAFLHGRIRNISWDWLPRLVEGIYNQHRWSGNIFSGEIAHIEVLLDSVIAAALIPLVIAVLVKFRPSFGLFTLAAFLYPLISGTTASMQRYALIFIPVYMLLAVWGRRAWIQWIILGISLPLQAYFLILFANWSWAG
jgi:hypothetical protein